MREHRTIGWMSTILAAVLLAGCSTMGAEPSTGSTVGAAAPSSGAALTGTVFTGYEPYAAVAGTRPREDGSITFRSGLTASDPRMSGTMTVTLYQDPDSNPVRLWGSYTLVNEAGRWVCQFSGLSWNENGTVVRDDVCSGGLAYKGMRAYIHATSMDIGVSFGAIGWIDETGG